MLKIVTYNVNGLRQRIIQYGSLLKLLDSLDADIICFQEIKLTRQELTGDLIMAEGYESFFSCTRTSGKGRTGYSGVSTFCRVKAAFSSTEVTLPLSAEEGFTGLLENSRSSESRNCEAFADMDFLRDFDRDEILRIDSEGRCVITDHGHFVLFNVYGPRADPEDAERTQFKANFYKILQKRWELLQQQKRRIIVVGDLNIAPSAIDRCEAGPDFEKNEFRRWLRSLLVKSGGSFLDIFREQHPERKDAYTCWPVHNGAEEFNFGSRIDHMLASGTCLHDIPDQPGHNFVTCHVDECDIMTQFRRWKPGMPSRWKGGRVTKLEGSDHVPVFVTLKGIPEIPVHSTPSLSARYIPEIRGSQQTIASVLMKRQMAERVKVDLVATEAAKGDHENVSSVGSVNGTLHSCTVSSTELSHSCTVSSVADAGEDESKGTTQYVTTKGHGHNRSLTDVPKKKKTKQNQPSQLSLRSFFQKVQSKDENGRNSVEEESNNLENSFKSRDFSKAQDFSKETPEVDSESNFVEIASAEERSIPTANCPPENDKKTALLEWQRIRQLMQDSIPLCEGHHEPCVARVVKKPGPNFGRRFYVCARGEGPASNPEARCDFFRWAGSKSKYKK